MSRHEVMDKACDQWKREEGGWCAGGGAESGGGNGPGGARAEGTPVRGAVA